MEYVVGFLFSPKRDAVLLIRKNKPEWQRGRLNGVGGKIEEGELPIDAMIREFQEEAGLLVRAWLPFHRERFTSGAVVHFFAACSSDIVFARSQTLEEIVMVPTADIGALPLLYNLPYLVPMASVLIMEPVDNIPVFA